MGLFGRGKGGGLMNVIRCDQEDYLVWKWRPLDQALNSTSRENAIRYGSSLRVKDGEVAIFVYKQKDGTMQDFIYGPYDDTIKTANFPILTSIVGLAFGGESPFQADIYFMNLAGVIKMSFAVPYFDVFDPRFLDFAVPLAVRGSITFKIGDPKEFIKTHRLINFSIDDLKHQIKDALQRRIKSVVSNAPEKHQIPVVQIERRIQDINDIIKPDVVEDLKDFAVEVTRLDISALEIDKDSQGYRQLRQITAEQQQATINAQNAINIKNMTDMQEMNARNLEESMRIQREETQRAQRLQTETQFIGAHALNRQSDVMQTAAESMGTSAFGGVGQQWYKSCSIHDRHGRGWSPRRSDGRYGQQYGSDHEQPVAADCRYAAADSAAHARCSDARCSRKSERAIHCLNQRSAVGSLRYGPAETTRSEQSAHSGYLCLDSRYAPMGARR